MRPKRILMLTHEFAPYPGGVARYCERLAHAAAGLGHEVTVVAPRHGDLPSHCDEERIVRFDGDVFHFKHLRRIRDIYGRRARAQSYDEVHAADWPAIIALRTIDTGRAARTATLHGSDVLIFQNSVRARWARAGAALASFSRIACNSRYTAGLLRSYKPELAARSIVTPLGVDRFWFEPPEHDAVSAFRRRVEGYPAQQTVLTVARLDDRKGQHLAIEAIGRLPETQRRHVRYVCVGKETEHGYANHLQQLAKQHSVQLVLTGRLDDAEVRAAYSQADLFMLPAVEHPSKIEGFGLVILEAAAQGLPSLITKVHAMPELITEGQTGWISSTLSELTDTLGLALASARSPSLHQRCVQRARTYSWRRCAELTYGSEVPS